MVVWRARRVGARMVAVSALGLAGLGLGLEVPGLGMPGLGAPEATGAVVSGPRPSAAAIVRAAIVGLARTRVFRTVTTSPSLDEVAVVEPGLDREAATSHLDGPAGRGVVRAVVAGGAEYLEGDTAGWGDLLRLLGASTSTVAQAASLAGQWYKEPPGSSAPVDRFGPSLGGIGHVFCTGRGCGLSGARIVGERGGEVTIVVPAFGGDLVVGGKGRLRPVELIGTGSHGGLVMRFAYPRRAPLVGPPASAEPAPAEISS